MKLIKYLLEAEDYDISSDQDQTNDRIVDFFKRHRMPNDERVHELATELDMEPDSLEQQIYSLFSSCMNSIGKHNDVPDEKFDQQELEMGIQVEMEHTNDPYISKLIAKDHLAELPDYYTRLKRMEKRGEQQTNGDIDG